MDKLVTIGCGRKTRKRGNYNNYKGVAYTYHRLRLKANIDFQLKSIFVLRYSMNRGIIANT